MDDAADLARIFLAHEGEFTPPAAPAALEGVLAATWERGRAAWPRIMLPVPVFVRHLATHRPAGADPERFLATVNAEDLYLACACAQGDPAALDAFDRSILSRVQAFLAPMDPAPSFADEVRQLLRAKLFVAPVGTVPKIAEYAGTGTLLGWVRVVATRTVVSLRRKRGERPGEDSDVACGNMMAITQDPELDYIRSRYQQDFKEALQAAFSSLPQEQRHVLRMHFSSGLTGDAIAAVLQVNRRTVVRWLASGKTAMFHETRRLLQDRLRLSPRESDSLIAFVRGQLDVSIATLLRNSQS